MEITRKIKKYLINTLKQYRMVQTSRKQNSEELAYSKRIELKTDLTTEEKNRIKALWGEIVPNIKSGYLAYKIYKQLHGFDERFVPEPYYYPYIMYKLNDKDASYTLAHKGLMPIYFRDVLQPTIVVNCINGNIFDNNHKIISLDGAVHAVMDRAKPVIIKPFIDTSSGKNVKIINTTLNKNEISNIIQSYGENYVIQELVEQSQVTSQINPTSLQTMRINTLFINGKCTAVKNVLRCGARGNIVDNLNAGGFMISINDDGRVNEFGYSLDGTLHTHSNDHKLGDIVLPNFKDVIDTAINTHINNVPNCSLVGWDFSLTKDNKPILIEANLKFPSCSGVQMCSSPMFGDRTQEVIDFVKAKKRLGRLFY